MYGSGPFGPDPVIVEHCYDAKVDSSLPSSSGGGHSPNPERSPLVPRPSGVLASFCDASLCIPSTMKIVVGGVSPGEHGRVPADDPSPGTRKPSVDDDWSGTPSLVHYLDFNNATCCPLLDDDLGNNEDMWKLCIIGYVAGKFLGYTALNNLISSTWKCNAKLTMHDSGWLIYTFSSKNDKLIVLSGGPYLVFGRHMVLKSMPEYFDFAATDMSRVPVWVKFPNLPLKCRSSACLSKFARVIGKPIHCDMLTTSMSRLLYARLLIEVDLVVELPTSINIVLPNGMPLLQSIVYESLPRFCKHCRVLDHTVSICTKVGGNKRKKHSQTISSPTNLSPGYSSFGPFAKTAAMEQQQVYNGMSHSEYCMDPMCAEVAAVVDS